MDNDFTKYLFASHKNTPTREVHRDISEQKQLSDVSQEAGCTGVEERIVELERKISKCCAELENGNIRSSLLRHHSKKVEHLLMQVDEIGRRIVEKYNNYVEKSNKLSSTAPVFLSRKTNNAEPNTLKGLESLCTKNVRETCEAVSSYFNEEYSVNAGLKIDPDSDVPTKDNLWSKAEHIYESFSAEEIHLALISNTCLATNQLKNETNQIDLKADAHNLKFNLEKGKLKDISAKPVLVQTVKQLIEESQATHFQKFLQSEQSKNEAQNLQEKLSALNERISDMINDKFDADKNLRKFLLMQQDLTSSIACKNYLKNEILKLEDEKSSKEASMKLLQHKYKQIKDFDRTVQCKQLMIQDLIKTNGSSKSRHRQQHQDIKDVVEKKILNIQKKLYENCEQYKELIVKEQKLFLKLPVANIHCIKSSESYLPVSSISIHRFDAYYEQPGEDDLLHVLNYLQVPTYAPAEDILLRYIQFKSEEFHEKINVDEWKERTAITSLCCSQLSKLKDDLQKARQEESRSYIFSVKESQRKSSDIMAQCVKFGHAVETWWNQPAQTTAPWVTEDDLSFQQYLERFKHDCEVLKKVQMVNQ